MLDLENMSKEELINLLNSKCNKDLEKKCSLKESFTNNFLQHEDYLFITSFGALIGKPLKHDEAIKYSPYIILENVTFLRSLYPPDDTVSFSNYSFNLAIDQIIAFSTVDKERFLSQLRSPQKSQD